MYIYKSAIFVTTDTSKGIRSPFYILRDGFEHLDEQARRAGLLKDIHDVFCKRLPRLTRLTTVTTHFDENALRDALEGMIEVKRAFQKGEEEREKQKFL